MRLAAPPTGDRGDRSPPQRRDQGRGRGRAPARSRDVAGDSRACSSTTQRPVRDHRAASSRPGAFPGMGLGAEVGVVLADTAALVGRQVALILAVAAAFDHDLDAHHAVPRMCARAAPDAGAAKFGERGVEFADGGRLIPSDPELSEGHPRARPVVVQRTVRRRARTLLGATSRSASAPRSAPARTSRPCAIPAAWLCAITISWRPAQGRLSVRPRRLAAHGPHLRSPDEALPAHDPAGPRSSCSRSSPPCSRCDRCGRRRWDSPQTARVSSVIDGERSSSRWRTASGCTCA